MYSVERGANLVAVLLWNTLEGVNVSYLPCGVIPTEIDTAEDQMVHRHPQEREREGERGLLLNKTCPVVTANSAPPHGSNPLYNRNRDLRSPFIC